MLKHTQLPRNLVRRMSLVGL